MQRVDVIIPTYNRANKLKRAVESVLRQTYQAFNLIIVDDGSTDNTKDIVDSFKDRRIQYIRLNKNRGAAFARNIGIESSNSKLIAFLDSDDEWVPKKLEIQLKVLESCSHRFGGVFSSIYIFSKDRILYWPNLMDKIPDDISDILLYRNIVAPSSVLVRRECFKRFGLFDGRFLPCEDWEIFFRFSKYYYFKYINEPMVLLYRQPDSIYENFKAKGYSMFLIKYRKIFKDKKIKKYHSFRIASIYKKLKFRDLLYLIKVIIYYPFTLIFLLKMFFSHK